jgi:hypothetical protein
MHSKTHLLTPGKISANVFEECFEVMWASRSPLEVVHMNCCLQTEQMIVMAFWLLSSWEPAPLPYNRFGSSLYYYIVGRMMGNKKRRCTLAKAWLRSRACAV